MSHTLEKLAAKDGNKVESLQKEIFDQSKIIGKVKSTLADAMF